MDIPLFQPSCFSHFNSPCSHPKWFCKIPDPVSPSSYAPYSPIPFAQCSHHTSSLFQPQSHLLHPHSLSFHATIPSSNTNLFFKMNADTLVAKTSMFTVNCRCFSYIITPDLSQNVQRQVCDCLSISVVINNNTIQRHPFQQLHK